jgi:hypothetical protein
MTGAHHAFDRRLRRTNQVKQTMMVPPLSTKCFPRSQTPNASRRPRRGADPPAVRPRPQGRRHHGRRRLLHRGVRSGGAGGAPAARGAAVCVGSCELVRAESGRHAEPAYAGRGRGGTAGRRARQLELINSVTTLETNDKWGRWGVAVVDRDQPVKTGPVAAGAACGGAVQPPRRIPVQTQIATHGPNCDSDRL